MTSTKLNRRSFVVGAAAAAGGGVALSVGFPFGRPAGGQGPGRFARGQRLGGDPAR